MKITGTQIKNLVKIKQLELSALQSQFDENLYSFKDEEKESVLSITKKIYAIEHDIAMLQEVQKRYNLSSQFIIKEISANPISLELAIKLVGGYGRISKKFRSAAKNKDDNSYSSRYTSRTRNKDEEQAKATISKTTAIDEFKKAEKVANKLRTQISIHNAKELDMPELDVFENELKILLED